MVESFLMEFKRSCGWMEVNVSAVRHRVLSTHLNILVLELIDEHRNGIK